MTTIVKSKSKISRRLGLSIWRNPKDAYNKRSYPPGQHGVTPKRRKSTFGRQLIAKQQLKAYCNLCERGFRKRFKDSERAIGNTMDLFIKNLATKLDVFLFDSGYISDSIFAIKQLISHGFVLVNGRKVNIRGYNLKIGDVVTFKEKLFNIPHVKEYMKASDVGAPPEYIGLDKAKKRVSLLAYPKSLEETRFPVEINMEAIVEFYAR